MTADTDSTSPPQERVLNDTGSLNVGTDTTRSFVLNTRPLFKLMVEKKASDLFFSSNSPIKIKIEGKIMPVNRQVLTADQVRQAAYGLMNQEQIDYFQQELEIDFAISEPGLGPFPRRRCSTSAATRPSCCVTSRRRCRRSKSWACRRSSKNWS